LTVRKQKRAHIVPRVYIHQESLPEMVITKNSHSHPNTLSKYSSYIYFNDFF